MKPSPVRSASLLLLLAASSIILHACNDPVGVDPVSSRVTGSDSGCQTIAAAGTISKSGSWCLANDIHLRAPGTAIRISASHVTFDLRGHALTCESCSTDEAAVGIAVDAVDDVVVRNGSVSGFYQGVLVQDPAGAGTGYRKIAADSLDAPTSIAIEGMGILHSGFRGIRADGRCIRVERNTVSDTRLALPGDHFVMGIEVYGPSAIVFENVIFDTYGSGTGEGVGIAVSDFGAGSVVRRNRISNAARSAQGDYGVWVGGKTTARITDNFITNFLHGIAFSSTTTGFYGGNVVANSETPYLVSSGAVVKSGESFEISAAPGN